MGAKKMNTLNSHHSTKYSPKLGEMVEKQRGMQSFNSQLSTLNSILPLTYLGNILYYAHLIQNNSIIDIHSHYVKQTYTNRCAIITANGIQDLTIPVIKPKEKTPIKDIRISTHDNWQQLHWRAIQSAYNSTPFFEYFCDDYAHFYEKKWDFLLDFNLEIQQTTLDLLNFPKIEFSLSNSYIETSNFNTKDLREVINPKKFNVTLYKNLNTPYYQTFDSKFGFTPNLSIIDLLFNMGNEARIYLKNISI